MKTQIGIIGGGPSGLLLSQLLHVHGIESVVLERQSEEYVLGRIRAGLLESRAIDVLKRAGVAANLASNGIEHEGVKLVYQGEMCRINFQASTGDRMTIYGQTELTRDLYEAHKDSGRLVIHGVESVELNGLETPSPSIDFTQEGNQHSVQCDFIVGCDGYHGVSRASIPEDVRGEYEVSFPFGWLGVLSDTVPVSSELIYAYHSRGFALCSMRSPTRSRYYIQVPLTDKVEDWSDDAFWAELKRRLPADVAAELQTGPSIEKSIAPLRSFVCEPMRWQTLFLVGDAAHIVPPTGAKGLNLAISDVHYLFEALDHFYKNEDTSMLDGYSEKALKRVWKSSRFSWSLTKLLHDFYEEDNAFSNKVREAEFDYLVTSNSAQRSFAENYVGLSY